MEKSEVYAQWAEECLDDEALRLEMMTKGVAYATLALVAAQKEHTAAMDRITEDSRELTISHHEHIF